MNICVYCGSTVGADSAFERSAAELGAWISARGHALVYGGGGVGLMDIVASAALSGGAEVTGVIPRLLVEREELKEGLTHTIVTRDMAERKAKMVELSDAFIALPGGPGTLEEVAETMSRVKLGLLSAPCVLLDVNGFFAGLATVYDGQVASGFCTPEVRSHLVLAAGVGELEGIFAAWMGEEDR